MHAIKRNDSGSGRGKKTQETKSPPPASSSNFIKALLRKNVFSPYQISVTLLPITQFLAYTVRWYSANWRRGKLYRVSQSTEKGPRRSRFSMSLRRVGFCLAWNIGDPILRPPPLAHRPTSIHMCANTCIQKRQPLGLGLGFTMIQMQKSVLICFPL